MSESTAAAASWEDTRKKKIQILSSYLLWQAREKFKSIVWQKNGFLQKLDTQPRNKNHTFSLPKLAISSTHENQDFELKQKNESVKT